MADTKITGLTEDLTPDSADLLATVDDPAGTPTNKKATISNVVDAPTDVSGAGWVLDEDNMASDSATQVPTQQSVKAYVDGQDHAAPEGTAVLSTGEVGGSKFLREDGDGTSSWQAIPGGGDLLAANNLSDVVSAATAYGNIKQAASTTATGAVELATTAEVDTGTDATRAITPDSLNGSSPAVVTTNMTEGTDKNFVTDAEATVIGNTSGTNTGDIPATYEAVVAASGGDYATIEAAISGGATSIFVRDGTYVLTSDVAILAGGQVVGESRDGVIIDGSGGLYDVILDGDGATLKNVTIQDWQLGLHATSARTDCHVENVAFIANTTVYNQAFRVSFLRQATIRDIKFTNGTASTTTDVLYDDATNWMSGTIQGLHVYGNFINAVHFTKDHLVQISDYWCLSTATSGTGGIFNIAFTGTFHDFIIGQGYIGVDSTASGIDGIDITNADDVIINGPTIQASTGGTAIDINNADNVQVNAYVIRATTGLDIGAGSTDVRVGAYNGDQATTAITDNGTTTRYLNKDIAVSDLADGTDGELITWDASGVPATVAAGTATHVLTSNGAGAAPTFQAAAGGGGGNPLAADTVVAASGGDYTTLAEALNAASSGDTIYIEPGSYTETTDTFVPVTNITVIGAGQEQVTVAIGGNEIYTEDDTSFEGITFTVTSTGALYLSGERNRMNDCEFQANTGTDATDILDVTGGYCNLYDNYIDLNGTASTGRQAWIGGSYTRFINNRVDQPAASSAGTVSFGNSYGMISGNHFQETAGSTNILISIGGDFTHCVDNNFVGGSNSTAILVNTDSNTISGNSFDQYKTAVKTGSGDEAHTITGNRYKSSYAGSIAFDLSTSNGSGYNAITGNTINCGSSTSTVGIKLDGSSSINNAITGNMFLGMATGVHLVDSAVTNTVIMGNAFAYVTTDINDSGTGTLSVTATDSDPLNTS